MTFFVSFNLDGAVNLVRPWIYFFLVAVAYHMSMRDEALGVNRSHSGLLPPASDLYGRHLGAPPLRSVSGGLPDRAA